MNESLLVNTLGHSAGVLIFGIFLVLLLRDRAARRLRGGVKSMVAALLALVWNVASLIVLGGPSPDTWFVRITIAIGFSVLSLLPAVLFDLCLERRYRPLVQGGYALERAGDRAAHRRAVPRECQLSPLGADLDHHRIRDSHADRGRVGVPRAA